MGSSAVRQSLTSLGELSSSEIQHSRQYAASDRSSGPVSAPAVEAELTSFVLQRGSPRWRRRSKSSVSFSEDERFSVSRAPHAASRNDVSEHASSDRRSSIAAPSPSPPPLQTSPNGQNGAAVNVDADDAAAYKYWSESEEKSRQGWGVSDLGPFPAAQVRNFVHTQKIAQAHRINRLRDLEAIDIEKKTFHRVGLDILAERILSIDASVESMSQMKELDELVSKSWSAEVPAEIREQFICLRHVTFWVDETLTELEKTALISQQHLPSQSSVPASPFHAQISTARTSHPLSSTGAQRPDSRPPSPANELRLGMRTRGRAETANSRARYWDARHAGRPTVVRAGRDGHRLGAVGGANVGGDALTMSSVSSYGQMFTTLGAVAFFGASIAWSSVFSATRGNLLLLVWSATLFILAAVAAASSGLIASSDQIDLERDMGARRVLRVLALFSAALVLAGIWLLSFAAVGLEDIADGGSERGRKVTWAAAAVTVGGSCALIGCAVVVRVCYSRNDRVWRF